MDFPSAIPSVGVVIFAIGLAKNPEDICKASKFVEVATHLHPEEKKQIRRVLAEKKAELQRVLDMAFLNAESLLDKKVEVPPSNLKVA